jgi:hypothetical protein
MHTSSTTPFDTPSAAPFYHLIRKTAGRRHSASFDVVCRHLAIFASSGIVWNCLALLSVIWHSLALFGGVWLSGVVQRLDDIALRRWARFVLFSVV